MKRLINRRNKLNNICNLLKNFKYRTVESSMDLSVVREMLSNLTEYNVGDSIVEELENIKTEDPDCIYNGTVYRKFSFNIDDIVGYDAELDDYISKEEVLNKIKNHIETGIYQSASKNLKTCEEFNPDVGESNFDIIVTYQVTDGISVGDLLDKYYKISTNILENEDYDQDSYGGYVLKRACRDIILMYNHFYEEQEVYGIMNDFEILSIKGKNISDLPDKIQFRYFFEK